LAERLRLVYILNWAAIHFSVYRRQLSVDCSTCSCLCTSISVSISNLSTSLISSSCSHYLVFHPHVNFYVFQAGRKCSKPMNSATADHKSVTQRYCDNNNHQRHLQFPHHTNKPNNINDDSFYEPVHNFTLLTVPTTTISTDIYAFSMMNHIKDENLNDNASTSSRTITGRTTTTMSITDCPSRRNSLSICTFAVKITSSTSLV
jgi:hypothetical protein